MAASLYDGEKASGPTPVMFASEPEVAYDAVESDLAKIHHDIMRINKSFLIFEHINLKAAAGVIKKNQVIKLKHFLQTRIYSLEIVCGI